MFLFIVTVYSSEQGYLGSVQTALFPLTQEYHKCETQKGKRKCVGYAVSPQIVSSNCFSPAPCKCLRGCSMPLPRTAVVYAARDEQGTFAPSLQPLFPSFESSSLSVYVCVCVRVRLCVIYV